MAAVTVRPARAGDRGAIAAVLAPSDAEHAAALPHIFNDRQTAQRAHALMAAVSRPDAALLLAERDGAEKDGAASGGVIGLICLELHQGQVSPGEEGRRYAWVLSINVLPRHRRTGVGRTLLQAGEAWAKGQGASHLEFDVWEFNRGAVAFYRTLGYVPMSRMMSKPL